MISVIIKCLKFHCIEIWSGCINFWWSREEEVEKEEEEEEELSRWKRGREATSSPTTAPKAVPPRTNHLKGKNTENFTSNVIQTGNVAQFLNLTNYISGRKFCPKCKSLNSRSSPVSNQIESKIQKKTARRQLRWLWSGQKASFQVRN